MGFDSVCIYILNFLDLKLGFYAIFRNSCSSRNGIPCSSRLAKLTGVLVRHHFMLVYHPASQIVDRYSSKSSIERLENLARLPPPPGARPANTSAAPLKTTIA